MKHKPTRLVKTNRPIIERMVRIAEWLSSGKPFTTSSLAIELEVSRKTIWLDICFMRDRLRYEMSFDPQKESWVGNPPKERIL